MHESAHLVRGRKLRPGPCVMNAEKRVEAGFSRRRVGEQDGKGLHRRTSSIECVTMAMTSGLRQERFSKRHLRRLPQTELLVTPTLLRPDRCIAQPAGEPFGQTVGVCLSVSEPPLHLVRERLTASVVEGAGDDS